MQIDNNGELIIGDNSNTSYKGSLSFEQGSELHLGTGAKLIINDGSRLIIKSNARLIVEYGATIELRGSNAVIEIQDGGQLSLGTNAVFSITRGNASNIGYIRFVNSSWASTTQPFININASTGAKFELEGNNINEKLLEVAGTEGIVSNNNLSLFSIKNGAIYMDTRDGKQPRIVLNTPIRIDHVKMTKASEGFAKHKGLHLHGQAGVNISDFTVEHAVWGIKALLFYSNNNIKFVLNKYTAKYCDVGLYSQGRGVDLIEPTFLENRISWQAEGMTAASLFTVGLINGVNKYVDYGILYKGSLGSPLKLYGSNIKNTISGVAMYSAPLYSWCNEIHHNLSQGYYIGTGSLLYSSGTLSAGGLGKTKFYTNPIDIRANQALSIYLDKGYNNFSSGSYDLYGNLLPVFNNTAIQANYNNWNTKSVNLKFAGINLPLTVVDNNPLSSPVTDCVPINRPKCCETTSIVKSARYSNSTNPVFASGPYYGLHLDEAVASATVDLSDDSVSVSTSINNLSQLLNYDFSNNTLSTGDSLLLDEAYHNMLEAVGIGVSSGKIEPDRTATLLNSTIAKVIHTQNNLLSQLNLNEDCIVTCTHICTPECSEVCQHECTEECSTCTEFCFTTCTTARDAVYLKKRNLTLDKATTYILAEKRIQAIEIIDSAYAWVFPEDQTSFNYWRCIASKELDYINGEISIYDTLNNTYFCSMNENSDSSTYIIDSTIFDSSLFFISKGKSTDRIFESFNINQKVYQTTEDVISNNGEKQNNILDKISIYPNPVQSELNIEIYSIEPSPVSIIVRDIAGKAIITLKVSQVLQRGKNIIQLSTREIPSGIYLLQIQKTDKIYQHKIVVVH